MLTGMSLLRRLLGRPDAEPSLLPAERRVSQGWNVTPHGSPAQPVPRPAVDHQLLDRSGRAAGLLARLDGQPTLLVLLSTTCLTCARAVDELPSWQAALGSQVAVRPLVLDTVDAAAAAFPDLDGFWCAPGAPGLAWARTLGLYATPSVALLSGDGTVLADSAGDYSTPEAVLSLLR
jgi:hypothetical protein